MDACAMCMCNGIFLINVFNVVHKMYYNTVAINVTDLITLLIFTI